MGKLSDQLNILAKMTPARAWNSLNLWSGYHISKSSGNPVMKGLPMSIAVEPTTSCNLRCPECPSGLRSFSRATGMMRPQLMQTIMEQLHQKLMYLTLYFQGEPYLNPDFFELVRIASGYNVYTATSTNAHYLNKDNCRATIESGLDRLIISIDGTTQDTYQQYRVGGNLEKVLEGSRNLIRLRKKLKRNKPHTIFQFLVVKPNEHQVDDLYELAREMEVDEVRFKTAQIYDYENGSPLIPENEKYSRYVRKPDGSYRLKYKLLNQCWRMWQGCVVTWDGKVVPCCFDKDASHILGDLNDQSFEEIWFGNEYRNFRSAILNSRDTIDICKNCTEGTKVWVRPS